MYTIEHKYGKNCGYKFESFCKSLSIFEPTRHIISEEYETVLKRLNADFRDIDSCILNGLYSGSYGRGVAIDRGNINMLYYMPPNLCDAYRNYNGNGAKVLLEAVKESLIDKSVKYPNDNDIQFTINGQSIYRRGIAQALVITPCFKNKDNSVTCPNKNGDGTWYTIYPLDEIQCIKEGHTHLKYLCSVIRQWRKYHSINISSSLIDTLANQFLNTWRDKDEDYNHLWTVFDTLMMEFFNFLDKVCRKQTSWKSIDGKTDLKTCFTDDDYKKINKAKKHSERAVIHCNNDEFIESNKEWSIIFGDDFFH